MLSIQLCSQPQSPVNFVSPSLQDYAPLNSSPSAPDSPITLVPSLPTRCNPSAAVTPPPQGQLHSRCLLRFPNAATSVFSLQPRTLRSPAQALPAGLYRAAPGSAPPGGGCPPRPGPTARPSPPRRSPDGVREAAR